MDHYVKYSPYIIGKGGQAFQNILPSVFNENNLKLKFYQYLIPSKPHPWLKYHELSTRYNALLFKQHITKQLTNHFRFLACSRPSKREIEFLGSGRGLTCFSIPKMTQNLLFSSFLKIWSLFLNSNYLNGRLMVSSCPV